MRAKKNGWLPAVKTHWVIISLAILGRIDMRQAFQSDNPAKSI